VVLAIPRSDLVVMDTNAAQSTLLGRGSFTYGSSWSPDGRLIAFRRRPLESMMAVPIELGLLAPDDGESEAVLLVELARRYDGISERAPDGPTWSPDGSELAFASERDADHSRIWVTSRSGGRARLLFPELEGVTQLHARWSPLDRDRLAYIGEIGGVQDLWLADLGSGQHQRLTQGELERLESPRWSADGERLAFAALPRERPSASDDRYEIYVLDLASGSLQRVTDDDAIDVDPAWAPDGGSLLISSTRETVSAGAFSALNLWRVWLDGSQPPLQLTRAGSSSMGADWYPFADCTASER
jgi:Tol biopolymer transport system component